MQHIVPALLRAQDHLDDFAHGAGAAVERGDVVGGLTNVDAGIGHGDAEPDVAHCGQIGKIVADEARLLRFEMKLRENLFDGGDLLLGPLPHDLDPELTGPNVDDVRVAAGDQAELAAGPLPELDAESVANVESFDLDSFIREDDAAVGEHAVDIGQNEFDRLAKLSCRHGNRFVVRGSKFVVRELFFLVSGF
jgi:hypothetical protein